MANSESFFTLSKGSAMRATWGVGTLSFTPSQPIAGGTVALLGEPVEAATLVVFMRAAIVCRGAAVIIFAYALENNDELPYKHLISTLKTHAAISSAPLI